MYIIENRKKTIYGCICQVYHHYSGWDTDSSNYFLKNQILILEKKTLLGKLVFKFEARGENVISESVGMNEKTFGRTVHHKMSKHSLMPKSSYYSFNAAEEAYMMEYIKSSIPNIDFISDFYISESPLGMQTDIGDSYLFRRCDYKIQF